MNKLFMSGILAIGMLFAPVVSVAFAQNVTTPTTVNFTATADMPGIADSSQNNTYKVSVNDSQADIDMTLTCQSGTSRLFGFVKRDKTCKLSGNGDIINSKNNQKYQRTQFVGGYTVKSTGQTNASDMTINYLALGSVQPSSEPFGGSLNLRPEQTSSSSQALVDTILNKISQNTSAAQIDKRTDTVDVQGFFIPSAGFPSDKGTTWDGNMVFSYQTNSWFLDLKATYNNKSYTLKGNMPWTNSSGVSNQTEYNLTLSVPNATTNSDDSLFATNDASNDLFATVDGIGGKIIMKQSNMLTVKIDGQDTDTPGHVEASGSFTGTNIPLDVVRSFSVMFGLLSDNFFGA